MEAKIIVPDISGQHNKNYKATQIRLEKSGAYRNLSTVIVCPTLGLIPAVVVQNWLQIIKPMNQRIVGPIFVEGMEVGAAYTAAVEMILGHPELSTYTYMLTIEEDNLIPPDGMMRLYESIEGQVDGQKYDAVGGIYFTKGEAGMPMCYGHPDVHPKNFIPFMPAPDSVQPCNGLGMGMTLFRMESLKHSQWSKPIFETVQRFTPGKGSEVYTQDLKHFENGGQLGFRYACDARVRVGHRDQNGIIW